MDAFNFFLYPLFFSPFGYQYFVWPMRLCKWRATFQISPNATWLVELYTLLWRQAYIIFILRSTKREDIEHRSWNPQFLSFQLWNFRFYIIWNREDWGLGIYANPFSLVCIRGNLKLKTWLKLAERMKEGSNLHNALEYKFLVDIKSVKNRRYWFKIEG